MTRVEIEAEILRLKAELTDYKVKKKFADSELNKMEDVLGKIRKKEREIEEGLYESLRKIEQKLERVNPKSKFRVNYLKDAKSHLFGSKSSAALQETRDAQSRVKKKIFAQEDKIEGYKAKIKKLEARIEELKSQRS